MENTQVDNIKTILFFTFFAFSILESICYKYFVRFYYLFGITLYKKEWSYSKHIDITTLADKLNKMSFDEIKYDVKFKNFGEGKIGFKETYKFLGFDPKKTSYSRVLRGILYFNQFENKIIIRGKGIWISLIFPIFMLYLFKGSLAESLMSFPVIIVLLFLSFIYYKQTIMYNKLITLLKDEFGILE